MASFLSLDDPRMLALRARADWRCVGLYMGIMHILAPSRYRLHLSPHVLTGLAYQLRISEPDLTDFLQLLAELNIVTMANGELVAPDQVEGQERKRRAAEKRWRNEQEPAKQPQSVAVQEPVFFVQHPEPAMQHPEPAMQHPEPAMQHPEPAMQHPEPAMQHPEPAMQHPEPAMQHPEPASRPLSPPHPPYPKNSLSLPPSLPLDEGKIFLPPSRETVILRLQAAGIPAGQAAQEADVYLSDRQRRHWEVQPGRHPKDWDWEADVRNWVARDRSRLKKQGAKRATPTEPTENSEPKPKKRLADIQS